MSNLTYERKKLFFYEGKRCIEVRSYERNEAFKTNKPIEVILLGKKSSTKKLFTIPMLADDNIIHRVKRLSMFPDGPNGPEYESLYFEWNSKVDGQKTIYDEL